MQTVVIVNLNGVAFHLEESAVSALKAYLDRAESELRTNPDQSEIVGDLEQAIADKCGRVLGPHKNVITGSDMSQILDEMGPVRDEDASGPAHQASATPFAGASAGASGAASQTEREGSGDGAGATPRSEGAGNAGRRLYRMLDSGLIGGVCSGVAAFSDTDVTVLRVGVVVVALLEIAFLHSPLMLVAYLATLFIIPAAGTAEERAEARGIPFNAQHLIDEAKANFERLGDPRWRTEHKQWRAQKRHEWRRERRDARWARRRYAWPPIGPGTYGSRLMAGVLTPMLIVINVSAFWFVAFIGLSLASTRGAFGWTLPGDVPLWLALIVLFILYHGVVGPLRYWRHASYYRIAGPEYGHYQALDGVLATVLSIAIVWSVYHYNADVRQWIHQLPEAWRNIVASFRS